MKAKTIREWCMVGFGRGFASDAYLAEAPGIIVRQVTTKDEG